MLSILDTGECTDYVLGYAFSVIKSILSILQIVAPIILIVGIGISFSKLVVSAGENKKHVKGILLQVLGIVFFFCLPWLVGAVLEIFVVDKFDEGGATYTLGSCWRNAEQIRNSIDDEDDKGVGNGTQGENITPGSGLDSIKDKTPAEENNEDDDNDSSGDSQSQNTAETLIFIGDSRTVGMKSAVGGSDTWSCLESKGYSWMKSTGVPQIEGSIGQNSAVIILMGVNDLGNANSYISYINGKANTWKEKGAKTYFVSVMPTDKGYDGLNTTINSFNQKMKSKLNSNVKYIDTNSYLKSKGFTTTDGLHYTNDTYKKIYNYIKNHL